MLKMYDDIGLAAFIYDFKARKKANSNSDCSLNLFKKLTGINTFSLNKVSKDLFNTDKK